MVLIISYKSNTLSARFKTLRLTRKHLFGLSQNFKTIKTKLQTIFTRQNRKQFLQNALPSSDISWSWNWRRKRAYSVVPIPHALNSNWNRNEPDIKSRTNQNENRNAETCSERIDSNSERRGQRMPVSNSLAPNPGELSLSYCCPIYHPFYSNKDYSYRFTYTEMCVKKYEKVLELKLRPNFITFPAIDRSPSHKIVEGPIFMAMSSPVVIQGDDGGDDDDDCGPATEWHYKMNIRRSYYEEKFDAQISLSCRRNDFSYNNKNRADTNTNSTQRQSQSQELFVGVELQLLSDSGDVQLSRRCDEGLRLVSSENGARYDVPYFLDLRTLQDPKMGLMHNFECYCRIVITSITGFKHDQRHQVTKVKPSWVAKNENKNSNLDFTNYLYTRQEKTLPNWELATGIIIKASNIAMKIPLSTVHAIHGRCPSLFSEIRNGFLHLETFTSNSVANIVRYILTGRVKNIIQNFVELQETIELARRYRLNRLKKYYVTFLGENLCAENAAQILVLSYLHGAGLRIRYKIKEYFLCNVEKVGRSANTGFYIENCPLAFASIIFGASDGQLVEEFDGDLTFQFTRVPLNSFLQDSFQPLLNG